MIACSMAGPLKAREDDPSTEAKIRIWTPIESDTVTINTKEWAKEDQQVFDHTSWDNPDNEGSPEEGFRMVGLIEFETVSPVEEPSLFFSTYFDPWAEHFRRLSVSCLLSWSHFLASCNSANADITVSRELDS